MSFTDLPEYKFFQIEDDRKLAYREYGENNNKVVICIHGLTRNSSDYHFLALKLLEINYRVIVPDIAGRGESDALKSPEDYNYHFYRDDILRFLDHLKIENCEWIGTSMGGVIAFLVNEMRSSFITKLILNDIGPQIPYKTTRNILQYFLRSKETFDSFEAIEKQIKLTFTFFGISKKEDWDFFINHSIKQNPDKTYSFRYRKDIFYSIKDDYTINEKLRGDGAWDLWAKLINIPILLIWGDLSTMLTIDTTRKMQQSHSNFQKITIRGVGHTPHFMNEELNSIVVNWMENGVLIKDEIKNFIL